MTVKGNRGDKPRNNKKKAEKIRPTGEEYVYVVRSMDAKMGSAYGFKWPKSGKAVARDWENTPKCGQGLHGLLLHQTEPGRWYEVGKTRGKFAVLKVRTSDIVQLEAKTKVKFPEAEVVHVGTYATASKWLEARHVNLNGMYGRVVTTSSPSTRRIMGGPKSRINTRQIEATIAVGHSSRVTAPVTNATVTTDAHCTVTVGDRSHVLALFDGSVRCGQRSRVLGSDLTKAVVGPNSVVTAGFDSHVVAGSNSRIDAERYSTAVGGVGSHLRVGPWCAALAGDQSTITAEDDGQWLVAGNDCCINADSPRIVMTGNFARINLSMTLENPITQKRIVNTRSVLLHVGQKCQLTVKHPTHGWLQLKLPDQGGTFGLKLTDLTNASGLVYGQHYRLRPALTNGSTANIQARLFVKHYDNRLVNILRQMRASFPRKNDWTHSAQLKPKANLFSRYGDVNVSALDNL